MTNARPFMQMRQDERGFSVFELMVTIAIFTVIMAFSLGVTARGGRLRP